MANCGMESATTGVQDQPKMASIFSTVHLRLKGKRLSDYPLGHHLDNIKILLNVFIYYFHIKFNICYVVLAMQNN